jgi:hypothetical protein
MTEVMNMDNPSQKDMDRVNAAQDKMYKSVSEYASDKLIKEYGEDKINAYVNSGVINTGKNAVNALVDEWYKWLDV